jgi:LL-diaminopimelate aminotransferase
VADAGLQGWGGVNSPYVWVKAPDGVGSWQMFDRLLSECHVACTPGVGFGSAGEGFVRFTAFNTHEATEEAARRLKNLLR